MQIISVQTGRARDVTSGRTTIHTGIDKQPVPSITVQHQGVEGDDIVATQHHGGPGQAVYAYARSDYEVFEAQLDTELPNGAFGENVTVDRWPHDPIRVGDRFVVEGVVLEVSAPRIPCVTFAARMGELVGPDAARGWVKRFTAERRPGWYLRVVAPGRLEAGQRLAVTPAPSANVTGLQMWDLHHAPSPDPAMIRRALDSPIDDRSRAVWTPATT